MASKSESALIARLSLIGPADLPSVPDARETFAAFRESQGWKRLAPALLTAPDDNLKLSKSGKGSKVSTYGLSLAPANQSGVLNVCPMSTRGCRELCLSTAGMGRYNSIQQGRNTKTAFLVRHPAAFLALLADEIGKAVKREARKGNTVGMRLNVLSDVRWEIAAPWLFDLFPMVTFYDYTKHATRPTLPANYSVTYSASERTSDTDIAAILDRGDNVTIVAHKVNGSAPISWHGRTVVNGDLSDFRPADPAGVVVWLNPKGKAQTVTPGGFVRTVEAFA